MIEWLSSKVATTAVVLIIVVSFLGLFGMQADHLRTLELEDLADAVTKLVTQVDLLDCEARVEVNWTSTEEVYGLPRTFQGSPYTVQFTGARPYLALGDERVAGRYFPTGVTLLDVEGRKVDMLDVPSTTGFTVTSTPQWTIWGLSHRISITPLDGVPPS